MNQNILTVCVLSLACGAASMTIAKSGIFAPFRGWLTTKWKATPDGSRSERAWGFLNELFGCPYCVSHWLAGVAVAIYRPQLTHAWWPVDLAVSTMTVVCLSAWSGGLIYRAFASVPHEHESEEDEG